MSEKRIFVVGVRPTKKIDGFLSWVRPEDLPSLHTSGVGAFSVAPKVDTIQVRHELAARIFVPSMFSVHTQFTGRFRRVAPRHVRVTLVAQLPMISLGQGVQKSASMVAARRALKRGRLIRFSILFT